MRRRILLLVAVLALVPAKMFAQWTEAEVEGLTFKQSSPLVWRLTWTAVPPEQCGDTITYSVYRATNEDFEASEENEIASGITMTHYVAHQVQPSRTYYYRVLAIRVPGQCSPANSDQRHLQTLDAQATREAKGPSGMSTVDRTMDALIGRVLYECPSEERRSGSRLYFDVTRSDGTEIPKGEVLQHFGLGYRLVIRGAETDMKLVEGEVFPSVQVILNVEEPNSKISAGVVIKVDRSSLTPTKIYQALLAPGIFTAKPVTGIRIGMTRDDVLCDLGSPDHTNYDALSGEQMVYENGTYVYVDKRGRVANIQTAY